MKNIKLFTIYKACQYIKLVMQSWKVQGRLLGKGLVRSLFFSPPSWRMILHAFCAMNSNDLLKQLSFKRKHRGVVPVHGPWSRISKTSHLKLKREDSRTEKRFKNAIMFSEKKGMDLWKQMSSSKCSFACICGIFLPLNPSTTTVYTRSAFYPSLRFTLSLQSAFYTRSAFYPWSAVCSLQSEVCVLHWPD